MENISNFTLTINQSYNINMTCFGITGLPDHIFKKVCVLENKRNSFVCPKYGLRSSSFLSLRYIGKCVNVATLQIVVLLNFVYSTWVTISYSWTTISRTIVFLSQILKRRGSSRGPSVTAQQLYVWGRETVWQWLIEWRKVTLHLMSATCRPSFSNWSLYPRV